MVFEYILILSVNIFYVVLKPYVLKTKALCHKKYALFLRNNTSLHVISEIPETCLDYYYLKEKCVFKSPLHPSELSKTLTLCMVSLVIILRPCKLLLASLVLYMACGYILIYCNKYEENRDKKEAVYFLSSYTLSTLMNKHNLQSYIDVTT